MYNVYLCGTSKGGFLVLSLVVCQLEGRGAGDTGQVRKDQEDDFSVAEVQSSL